MRLIDADALPRLTQIYEFNGKQMEIEIVNAKSIDTAPTVDAVPVVRCKDCKCWLEWENGTGSCSRFALDWHFTDADDFCSFGERKDNE